MMSDPEISGGQHTLVEDVLVDEASIDGMCGVY
jgi:mycofactocin precursor